MIPQRERARRFRELHAPGDPLLLVNAWDAGSARVVADAGADGLFAPGLIGLPLIEAVCRRSPLPVNVMARPGLPLRARLIEAGVARISHGPAPYRRAMEALAELARSLLP